MTTYSSEAFRNYARAQIDYADSILIKHQSVGCGLCLCGRTHPCHDGVHWQRMRAHFVQFVGDPETWPAMVRPYVG